MKFDYDFPYKFHDLQSSFQDSVVINTKTTGQIVFIINLTQEYLKLSGTRIILVVECTQTFYRKQFVINTSSAKVEIPKYDVGNKGKYSLILVANREGNLLINGYEDFYERGDCLGLLAKGSFSLSKENRFGGLIKVGGTSKNDVEFDLTSDWITILLPNATYKRFIDWQSDLDAIPMIKGSLGFACIQFAILEGLKEGNIHQERHWWETISVTVQEMGFSINDIDSSQVPQIANLFLGKCIEEMLITVTSSLDSDDTSILA